ncbi:MAG: ATP-binding protein [Ardenticatenaceae bacterium]|nr:ATP-binding protein [Ardenticatenaceae bacterium]
MNQANRSTELRQQISQHFNDEELRTLCVDVGAEYDDLGGRGKEAQARELVAWAERNGKWETLLAAVKAARPYIAAIAGLLPPHHIPFHQNELFTGREAVLAELQQRLSANSNDADGHAAITVAVAGLGGTGKTQVALAYCYGHLADYDLIYWLPADEPTTLGIALAEMAVRLGPAPRQTADYNALRRQVLDWLQTTEKRWLLVFDNADQIDPAALEPFLPKLGNGANLITTRNPNWGGLAQTVLLDLFTEAEAVAFLLKQLPQTAQNAAEASQLADLLGYLPLALEHARAYVAATGCSLADYAGYFATERQELWAEAAAPLDYQQRTVTTTWELAFAQVQQVAGAAALLNLGCFLAAEPLPLSLLAAAMEMEAVPEPLRGLAGSKRKLDKAIAALRRYSLLTRDGETVALHRLVQLVARDRMPPELRQTWLRAAVALLNEAWPFDQNNMETWEESGRLLSHLLAVLEVANGEGVEETAVASLNSQADFYLSYLGNFTAALPYSKRALAIDENTLGSDHPSVARDLNNLGGLLWQMGEYEPARPLLERALIISKKTLGSDHPQVAADYNNLGQLLQTIGEYKAALPFLERALIISEKALGLDHPQVAAGNNNLGQLLQDLGEYEAARPFLARALVISENALGSDHPQVAIRLNNLGLLLQAMGKYRAAQPLLERALSIWDKALGSDHPQVAIGNNNLGLLLQDLGEYEAARLLLERALITSEKAFSLDHPQVAAGKNNLGQLLQAMGDYKAAQPFMERALAIDEKALGSDHPSVARDLNNLGRLLQALREYDAARPFMERALAICTAKLGENHPHTQIVRDNLAALLRDMGASG